MRRAFFALSILIALWVTAVLWTQENTLSLAASGKIGFGAAWGYRFRDGAMLGSADVPLALQLFRPAGVRLLCTFLILLQLPALLRRSPRVLTGTAALASLCSIALLFSAANPALVLNRQRVMGGNSPFAGIGFGQAGEKIPIDESCVAVVNPSDLYAVSSLELIDKASARKLRQPRLIDLKIVEENYRLLYLKDEKGSPVFSDAARAFASAEKLYAQKARQEILAAPELCLIANFDILPQNESQPFSRARQISDERRKAGKDTKVIQLPAGFARR